MTLGVEELEIVRQNLITESSNAWETHLKALGAIELLDYLLAQLQAESEDGIRDSVDSGPETGDDSQASLGGIHDNGREEVKDTDARIIDGEQA